DRVVDVVVSGVADVAGGDGAVRVDHGVSADRDDHGVRKAKQLAAVDGLRAGGVHRARGHARDHHVARINAAGGDARAIRDHQAGIAQAHVIADLYAGVVDRGVANHNAAVNTQVDVL